LVNKYRTLSKGYFYTTTYINTETTTKWKYIPFDGETKIITDETKTLTDENIMNTSLENISFSGNVPFSGNISFSDNVPFSGNVPFSDNMSFSTDKTFLDYDLLDNHSIEEGSLIGIIGKAESGKSLIVDSILKAQTKEYLKDTLIVTNSHARDSFYRNRHPIVRVITFFEHRIIREYLNKDNGCVIIDDMVIPKRIRGTIWETIFFDNKKTRIITSQKDAHFNPKVKRAINYMFYLRDDNEKTIQKIFNNYGQQVFDSIDEFEKMFNHMTDNYGSMVFKRVRSNGNNYKVFRYNAIHKIKLD